MAYLEAPRRCSYLPTYSAIPIRQRLASLSCLVRLMSTATRPSSSRWTSDACQLSAVWLLLIQWCFVCHQAQAQTAPNYSNVLVSPTVYVTQPQYQCPVSTQHCVYTPVCACCVLLIYLCYLHEYHWCFSLHHCTLKLLLKLFNMRISHGFLLLQQGTCRWVIPINDAFSISFPINYGHSSALPPTCL